ncbi:MAG: hypothetical protein B7X10_05640 [Burkholderiales bacterium 21-58-4]|nr:MAG: hypothetical protein B7X10_05640 [Burkholderiales bacterium 21-58-4]
MNFIKGCDGSEIFKLNLYPIGFHNTDGNLWKKYGLEELTGFSEKHLFKTWCFLNRFPRMAALASEKHPKLIIGTGINYVTDFFACFAGYDVPDIEIKSDEITQDGSTRVYYWARLKQGTTLVVTPFLSGRYGLNSDNLLQEMGNRISKLIA